ncbi:MULTISPECIES: fimbrial biogenesis usher protein [unclassified Brenneria]|uniref:fimbrial biogenesis usher protein n=1 Tax=unclassified Brenneria TaxID=2634434 RepID=UPI0029C42FAE|nr:MULTISPECIES: fimbrial biogenesis usher protein [unclassified Brenneria]MDX5627706.1 fimbrial biogenesis usher protein [Brenneria sp. L3-3Z]MDX5695203.1 fimbrial biogenesis usher protein [Brenneria sp. L4-2C]
MQSLIPVPCRLKPLYQAMILSIALPFGGASAEEYFNPSFLSNDPSAVADLSRFERGEGQPPGLYRVDIYINDEFVASRDVAFHDRPAAAKTASVPDNTGLEACLTRPMLEQFGVNVGGINAIADAPKDKCLSLPTAIPDATSTFDFGLQRLYLSVPQIALSHNGRGYIPPEQWDDGITTALLNYHFTGSNTSGDTRSDNYFLNLDSGINWQGWRLRDFSTWNYSKQRNASNSDWQHVSTYLQHAVTPWRSQVTLGDSTTPGEVFDSLGFRGVQLASDDTMLPDSLRGFAPTIRGIAKSNARVTVRQNGYVIYQAYVAPGAFVINDLYPTSSSGDLQVTVTESDNSVNSFNIPYSAVPLLQREGHIKYAVTLAEYRSNLSQQSKPKFAQGTLIWGLPYGTTLYGGSQLSDDYKSVAIGAGQNLGHWGALSLDVTQAHTRLSDDSEHDGQSLRFLYAKSLNEFGTNFQLLGYRYSTKGFFTLDEASYKNMRGYTLDDTVTDRVVYRDYYDLRHAKKSQMQANISQQLGDGLGSLFFSANRQTYWQSDRTNDLWQAGYSGNYNHISYNLTYSYNKSRALDDSDRMVSLNLSLPLGEWLSPVRNKGIFSSSSNSAYATYNATADNHHRTVHQAGVSGTLLEDNNLNYSVRQGYGNKNIGYSGGADLNYQGAYGNSNVGYSYYRDYHQVNYGLDGGIVAHANGITLSQPLGDTNVLIKAPGAEDVRLNNTTGIRTDRRGYAVIPYASVYRANRIALDVDSLKTNTEVDNAVVNVVPTRGALVLADFHAHVGSRVLITLQQRNGKIVPFGAQVTRTDSDYTGIVGDNGQVFLSGLPKNGTLKVEWGGGAQQQCLVDYTLPGGSENQPITYLKSGCQ